MANDPFDLRRLPALTPPDDLWRAIADDLEGRSRPAPRQRWRIPLALSAAVVVVAVFLSLLRPGLAPEGVVPGNGPLERLQLVSTALELQLDTYRGTVINAGTADTLARMERELAWLDMRLGDNPDDPVLWAERVALLGSMVERYMAADWRSDFRLASY